MASLSNVLVIVHPEGGLDRRGAGYWTEVVDLPVCFEQASGVAEVIAATEAAVRARLAQDPAQDQEAKITIEYAF